MGNHPTLTSNSSGNGNGNLPSGPAGTVVGNLPDGTPIQTVPSVSTPDPSTVPAVTQQPNGTVTVNQPAVPVTGPGPAPVAVTTPATSVDVTGGAAFTPASFGTLEPNADAGQPVNVAAQ